VACNPPFGDRLLEEAEASELLSNFCSRLKHNSKGVRLALFLKKGPMEKAPGLRAKRKMSLQNGTFDARFLVYDLF
jgi:23S rRNA G2445 N2-methylase RlmL